MFISLYQGLVKQILQSYRLMSQLRLIAGDTVQTAIVQSAVLAFRHDHEFSTGILE